MTYATIEPPAAEPLTLSEVKAHLRIDHDDEDALLAGLARAAREHLEAVTGLRLITCGMRLYLDDWPEAGWLELARGPVQAIDEIRVFDAGGEEVSLDLSGMLLDGSRRPSRLWLRERPLPGQRLNGIEIDFTAGFGESGADVPDTLRRAMLIHVAQMYEFRGAVPLAMQPAAVPEGYDRLIAPFLPRRL